MASKFFEQDWADMAAKRPEFASAEKVWTAVIEPELTRREQDRRETVRGAFARTAMFGIGGFIAVMVLGSIAFRGVSGDGFIIGLIAASLIAAAGSATNWLKVASLKTQNKELVLGAAAEAFGFKYETLHPDVSGLTSFKAIREFAMKASKSSNTALKAGSDTPPTPAFDVLYNRDLLPDYHDRDFEDLITGVRAGAEFSLVECKLTKTEGSGKNRRTVTKFQGLLVHVQYPKPFLGQTVVARSKWWRMGSKLKGLEKVKLNVAELDKAFTVYSNDQVEARYLLTPDKMERMVMLEQFFSGGKLRCIFEGDHLTIALEAPDQFEGGSIFKPLVDPKRFKQGLHEMELICDLIDGFLSREWAA